MRSSEVSFRKIVPEYDNVPVADRKEMEIIEIKFPDGKVCAFPANDVNPESGRKYSEIYGRKYLAFKEGKPDPDRVKELEREIAERQAELDGLTKDDKRVQENLGKIKPDEAPHNTQKTPNLNHPVVGAEPIKDPVLGVTHATPVLGQPKHENIV